MAHLNVDRATLEPHSGPPGFAASSADVGSAIGGAHLGGSLIDVPPGRKAWPYHWEAAQEEWLIVLAGRPTIRTPDGEEQLDPGDVVCFPAGPDGAHQVRNATDEPCRLLMVSNRAEVNVIGYVDSGKVGVRTPWLRGNFPEGAGVAYWEGE